MDCIWPEMPTRLTKVDKRATSRRSVTLAARLAWKDNRGINRFASVVTRDVSEQGVYVECQSALSIPLFRLVQFQLEPTAREMRDLPDALRQGRILSAVYRVSHGSKRAPQGFALRLMVEPHRRSMASEEGARATA
jgi:hypothetical protein